MSTRRRFVLSAGLGALAATVLFVVVLQSGRGGWLDHDLFGNFYDGQARALLDGHLDVDPDVPGIEGFRIGDRTHIYQGLTPALARLPLLAVTERFDGRLTGLSMLAAFVVAMGYVVAAGWRVRRLVRADRPIGTLEGVMTAVATFGIGSGTLLFLGSKAWVYHEALIWGAALCLASFTHLLIWTTRQPDGPDRLDGADGADSSPAPRVGAHLILATVFAGLAINTRSSIGLGPFAALGVVGIMLLLAAATRPGATSWASRPLGWAERVTAWSPRRSTRSPLTAAGVLAALALVAVVLYAGVNHARFGSWFGVPLDRQVLVATDPTRTEALDANDGSLFGLQYVPSVLVQILRPDAIGTQAQFPFLSFPERPAVIGDAVFAELDWSSSVPTSQPLLFLGSLVGLAALVAPRRLLGLDRGDDAPTTQPPVAGARLAVGGAAVSGVAIIGFGYIAHRYLTDVYPFFVLCALVGLHAVASRLLDRDGGVPRHRWVGGAVVAAILLCSVWTAWTNTALALQYGREIAPGLDESTRAAWIRTQSGWGGAADPVLVPAGEGLPAPRRVGEIAVVGECEGLYRSNGTGWFLVELGERGGGSTLELTRRGALDEPVAIAGTPAGGNPERTTLVMEPLGGDEVRLVVERGDDEGITRSLVGPTFTLAEDESITLDVMADWRTDKVVVRQQDPDRELLRVELPVAPPWIEAMGDDTVAVTGAPLATPTCDELLAATRGDRPPNGLRDAAGRPRSAGRPPRAPSRPAGAANHHVDEHPSAWWAARRRTSSPPRSRASAPPSPRACPGSSS